ncbi:MGMT family protein [Paenibacillus sp. TRM 82003]|nr:MGMT family protein [Paenibacillus sp. TRM 82003]
MTPFTTITLHIIRSIPPGRVMTYGQIAQLAGNHRAARQVVRILHSSSRKYGLPWHRVVNARGEIARIDGAMLEEQAQRLRDEGVPVDEEGRLDLSRCLHVPDDTFRIEVSEQEK